MRNYGKLIWNDPKGNERAKRAHSLYYLLILTIIVQLNLILYVQAHVIAARKL